MSALETAYGILTHMFNNVIQFVFNGMMIDGTFSYGEVIIAASVAWYAIQRITKSALNVQISSGGTEHYKERSGVD